MSTGEKLELPSLAYKKWHLQQQTETCDVVSLGEISVVLDLPLGRVALGKWGRHVMYP